MHMLIAKKDKKILLKLIKSKYLNIKLRLLK